VPFQDVTKLCFLFITEQKLKIISGSVADKQIDELSFLDLEHCMSLKEAFSVFNFYLNFVIKSVFNNLMI
jgi:hypothetical protein